MNKKIYWLIGLLVAVGAVFVGLYATTDSSLFQGRLSINNRAVVSEVEANPVTCYKIRSRYSDSRISSSSSLTAWARNCAETFPSVWYETRPSSDEECEEFRRYFDEGLISSSRVGSLNQIAIQCAQNYPIGWYGVADAPAEESPVTCYELRNAYSNGQISSNATLSDRSVDCADAFPYIWYETRPSSDEECEEFRRYFDEGLISSSRISSLHQMASHCSTEYPEGWGFFGDTEGDFTSEGVSIEDFLSEGESIEDSSLMTDVTDDFYPLTADTVTVRLINSPGGSNSYKSVQFVGSDWNNAAAIFADEVFIDSDGEVAVNLEISDETRDDTLESYNAGDTFDLEANDGAFTYDVYVVRIQGTEEGYVLVDLAIQP